MMSLPPPIPQAVNETHNEIHSTGSSRHVDANIGNIVVGIYSIPWVGNNIISLIILLISISSLKCIPKNNNNNSHNLKLRRPTTTLLKFILLDSTNYISDFAVA